MVSRAHIIYVHGMLKKSVRLVWYIIYKLQHTERYMFE